MIADNNFLCFAMLCCDAVLGRSKLYAIYFRERYSMYDDMR